VADSRRGALTARPGALNYKSAIWIAVERRIASAAPSCAHAVEPDERKAKALKYKFGDPDSPLQRRVVLMLSQRKSAKPRVLNYKFGDPDSPLERRVVLMLSQRKSAKPRAPTTSWRSE